MNLGKKGEQLAAHFLIQKGYEVVMQNFWTRVGEIDIIAQNKDFLIFVEVKAKTSIDFGEPYEQVTPAKLKKMMRACKLYCSQHAIGDRMIRLDVISIYCELKTKQAHIKHFENITG